MGVSFRRGFLPTGFPSDEVSFRRGFLFSSDTQDFISKMNGNHFTSNKMREVMKDSVEESAGQVTHDLERFITALGTVAAIAPLIGLLGTVFGMIEVFTAMVQVGAGNAAMLAGGISKALITTAAGLMVAIPALICHRFFERRIDGLAVAMEEQAIRLVDAMHGDRLPPGDGGAGR